MPQGKSVMGFLSKKMWHPTNPHNRKRKWLVEQEEANNKKRLKEKTSELKRERNKMEGLRLAAMSGDNEASKELRAAQMSFMYEAPPGLEKEKDSGEHQQDEDEAVRAFNAEIEKRKKKRRKKNGT